MAYFKINNIDYSKYVNKLNVTKTKIYNEQTNANGNTVVDLINTKRIIEVGIIPLDAVAMAELQTAIDNFNVLISFRNPLTNALEENVNCIIPENAVEYYTIQNNKVLYNAFTIQIQEL